MFNLLPLTKAFLDNPQTCFDAICQYVLRTDRRVNDDDDDAFISLSSTMRKQRHLRARLSPSILIYILLVKTITRSQSIRCGEQMTCSLLCPNPDALWYGSDNQMIVNNSQRYHLKYSPENVQLIIVHVNAFDQGEYICMNNNQSESFIHRYQLQVGTMHDLLPLFFLCNSLLFLFFPIVWYWTRKYSTIDQ